MATKKQQEAEIVSDESIQEAIGKTELWMQNNGRKVICALVAVFVVVGAVFAYKYLYTLPRNTKAAESMFMAEQLFKDGDYETALNGDGSEAGFAAIVDKYASTPAGNLARQYAAECCMKLGDYDAALSYLTGYKHTKGAPNAIVNAQNYGLQGDVYVQKGDYSKAADLYRKAVEAADNVLTTPAYLKKLGLVYEKTGDRAAALKAFNRIADEYPMSIEAREAGKFIGAAGQE